VVLDGAGAYDELARDLGVGLPLGQQAQYLRFAGGERLGERFCDRRRGRLWQRLHLYVHLADIFKKILNSLFQSLYKV